ncbi:MAG: hypothetical protein AAAB16_19235 [Pseudomonas sp.]|uniref:hypothetical protein n=1 Tax=Pseudomonas sp. TaxID=306 RepID=UPI0030F0B13B
MQLTENEMRRALGLELGVEPVKDDVKREKRVFPHTLVTYSVRKAEGGPTFKFEYKSRSISVDIAKLDAEKEIKSKGLVVWALLDVQQIS